MDKKCIVVGFFFNDCCGIKKGTKDFRTGCTTNVFPKNKRNTNDKNKVLIN